MNPSQRDLAEKSPATHYQVLDVSPSLLTSQEQHLQAQLLKRAYHRALLRHHPDKTSSSSETSRSRGSGESRSISDGARSTPLFTVDQITGAYNALRDPSARREYDLQLKSSSTASGRKQDEAFQTGVEVVDLDDLTCEQAIGEGGEQTMRWYRDCRCGNPRGFEFEESVLDEAIDAREFLVGCQDCSLWLKVQFDVEEAE